MRDYVEWAGRKFAGREGLVPVEVDVRYASGKVGQAIRYKSPSDAKKLISEGKAKPVGTAVGITSAAVHTPPKADSDLPAKIEKAIAGVKNFNQSDLDRKSLDLDPKVDARLIELKVNKLDQMLRYASSSTDAAKQITNIADDAHPYVLHSVVSKLTNDGLNAIKVMKGDSYSTTAGQRNEAREQLSSVPDILGRLKEAGGLGGQTEVRIYTPTNLQRNEDPGPRASLPKFAHPAALKFLSTVAKFKADNLAAHEDVQYSEDYEDESD
jgi:hypothetical protein